MTIINDDFVTTDLVEDNSVDLTVTSPPYNVGKDYDSHADAMPYQDYLDFSRPLMLEHCTGQEQGRPAEHIQRPCKRGQASGMEVPHHDCLERGQHLAPDGMGVVDERKCPVRDSAGGNDSRLLQGILAEGNQGAVRYNPRGIHRVDQRAVDIRRRKCQARGTSRAVSCRATQTVHQAVQLRWRYTCAQTNRRGIGVEVASEYCELARRRISSEAALCRSSTA